MSPVLPTRSSGDVSTTIRIPLVPHVHCTCQMNEQPHVVSSSSSQPVSALVTHGCWLSGSPVEYWTSTCASPCHGDLHIQKCEDRRPEDDETEDAANMPRTTSTSSQCQRCHVVVFLVKFIYWTLTLLCVAIILVRLGKWAAYFSSAGDSEAFHRQMGSGNGNNSETVQWDRTPPPTSSRQPVDAVSICLSHPFSGSGVYLGPSGAAWYDRYITRWTTPHNSLSQRHPLEGNNSTKFNGKLFVPFDILVCGLQEEGNYCTFHRPNTQPNTNPPSNIAYQAVVQHLVTVNPNKDSPSTTYSWGDLPFQHCQTIVFGSNVHQFRVLARMATSDVLLPNNGEIGFRVLFHHRSVDLAACRHFHQRLHANWIFLPIAFHALVNLEAYQAVNSNEKCPLPRVHLASAISSELTERYLFVQESRFFPQQTANPQQTAVQIMVQRRALLVLSNITLATELHLLAKEVHTICRKADSLQKESLSSLLYKQCRTASLVAMNDFRREAHERNRSWVKTMKSLCQMPSEVESLQGEQPHQPASMEWLQLFLVKVLLELGNTTLLSSALHPPSELLPEGAESWNLLDNALNASRAFARFMTNSQRRLFGSPLLGNSSSSSPSSSSYTFTTRDCTLMSEQHKQVTRNLIDFRQEFPAWQARLWQMARENRRHLLPAQGKVKPNRMETEHVDGMLGSNGPTSVSNLSLLVVQLQNRNSPAEIHSAPMQAMDKVREPFLDDVLATVISLLAVLLILSISCNRKHSRSPHRDTLTCCCLRVPLKTVLSRSADMQRKPNSTRAHFDRRKPSNYCRSFLKESSQSQYPTYACSLPRDIFQQPALATAFRTEPNMETTTVL